MMKKVKLRDMTYLQFIKYCNRKKTCEGCIFNYCGKLGIIRKNLYNDDFLEQEIEIEEE